MRQQPESALSTSTCRYMKIRWQTTLNSHHVAILQGGICVPQTPIKWLRKKVVECQKLCDYVKSKLRTIHIHHSPLISIMLSLAPITLLYLSINALILRTGTGTMHFASFFRIFFYNELPRVKYNRKAKEM